jgi:hypothetical protein
VEHIARGPTHHDAHVCKMPLIKDLSAQFHGGRRSPSLQPRLITLKGHCRPPPPRTVHPTVAGASAVSLSTAYAVSDVLDLRSQQRTQPSTGSTVARRPKIVNAPGSLLTQRWREPDSNPRSRVAGRRKAARSQISPDLRPSFFEPC